MDSIRDLQIGDLSGLVAALQLLLKMYEDLTGVNDPRRGSGLRSHTTATASTIEADKGIARTEDYVDGQSYGFLRTLLYMEFRIIKRMMRGLTPIRLSACDHRWGAVSGIPGSVISSNCTGAAA